MDMNNFALRLPCDVETCSEKLDQIDNIEWHEKLNFLSQNCAHTNYSNLLNLQKTIF